MFSGEAANIKCIVFCLTRAGIESNDFFTQGDHVSHLHYRCDLMYWLIYREFQCLNRYYSYVYMRTCIALTGLENMNIYTCVVQETTNSKAAQRTWSYSQLYWYLVSFELLFLFFVFFYILVKNDMAVNEHERLSKTRLTHKLNQRSIAFLLFYIC